MMQTVLTMFFGSGPGTNQGTRPEAAMPGAEGQFGLLFDSGDGLFPAADAVAGDDPAEDEAELLPDSAVTLWNFIPGKVAPDVNVASEVVNVDYEKAVATAGDGKDDDALGKGQVVGKDLIATDADVAGIALTTVPISATLPILFSAAVPGAIAAALRGPVQAGLLQPAKAASTLNGPPWTSPVPEETTARAGDDAVQLPILPADRSISAADASGRSTPVAPDLTEPALVTTALPATASSVKLMVDLPDDLAPTTANASGRALAKAQPDGPPLPPSSRPAVKTASPRISLWEAAFPANRPADIPTDEPLGVSSVLAFESRMSQAPVPDPTRPPLAVQTDAPPQGQPEDPSTPDATAAVRISPSATVLASPAPAPMATLSNLRTPDESLSDPLSTGLTLSPLALQIGPQAPQTAIASVLPNAPMVAQLAAQLVAGLVSPKPGVTEISLSPEELGRVKLRLQADARNPDRMVVMLSFDRPETLDLFRRHADQLVEAIRSAGYSGVDIAFAQQGHQDQPQTGTSAAAKADLPAMPDPDPAISPLPPRRPNRSDAGLDLRL